MPEEDVWTCWCGHVKEQHGPYTYPSKDYPEGIFREDACLVCDGKCDEWQPEFCDWVPFEDLDQATQEFVLRQRSATP